MPMTDGDDGIPFIDAGELSRAPAAVIDAARRQSPLLRTAPKRLAALRLADVQALATDPRLLQLPGAAYCDASGIPAGRCRSFLERFMLMSNGADHKARRGAFALAFAHPVIRGKRAQVRAVADRIVADLPRGEPFDFLDLCASRLPSEMIAEVLGLPVADARWFASEVYSLSRCLMLPYDSPRHDAIEASAEALHGFVAATLDDRRKSPRDDLLSMVATDTTARALDPDDLVYQVMGLILAGSDTTRSGFNVTVGRLLSDRALWDEIRADRTLIPAAIDEALRIDPPVGSLPRFVPAPVEIGGITVPAGQLLGLSSLSAMRDDAAIARPEAFDLHRTDQVRPHLVFGGGAHRCLGEMLARLELEEGLGALMDHVPEIALVEAPRMLGFAGIRRSTPLIARIG